MTTNNTMDKKDRPSDPEMQAGSPHPDDFGNVDSSSISGGSDILSLQDVDPVLNLKMHLVNNVSCIFLGDE